MNEQLISIFLLSISAAIIKYIDDVNDEDYLGGKFASKAFVVSIITIPVSMYLSAESCLFFIAIAVGCLFSGKLDIKEFKIHGFIIIIFGSFLILTTHTYSIFFVLFWMIVAFVDELLNNISDKKQNSIIYSILYYKPLMPISSILGCILGFNSILFVACILAFDISYALIKLNSKVISKIDFITPQLSTDSINT